MELTLEQIRALARLERKMDSGEQPYVVAEGGRMSVGAEEMEALGLKNGQTISNAIAIAICKETIKNLEALKAETCATRH